MSGGSSPRLDKWLWAARFFKTRSLARQAVEGGKVHLDGQRAKPGKPVHAGMTVTVRKGPDEWVVEVTGLSEKRGSAAEAQKLYTEDPESIARREKAREQRRFERASRPEPDRKPDKWERRQLERFRKKQLR